MLKFITAEERLSRRPPVNIAMFGPSKVGKTTQCRHLNPEKTLFIDGEAGTLSLGDWKGTVFDVIKESQRMKVHPWEMCRAVACMLHGPDPAAGESDPYSQSSYDAYVSALGDPDELFGAFSTVFADSVTVMSRWAFAWAQMQPEAFTKDNKPDIRGAYGLLSREMVRWLTIMQHQPKSVVVVGILDKKEDDFGRPYYTPQIMGQGTGRELPGIFDVIVTLHTFQSEDGETFRAFVCQQDNPYGFPAGARGQALEMMEPPNLAQLMKKISNLEPKPLDAAVAPVDAPKVAGSMEPPATAAPPQAAPEGSNGQVQDESPAEPEDQPSKAMTDAGGNPLSELSAG